MSSASTSSVSAPTLSSNSSTSATQLDKVVDQTLEPFRQAITVLEHKVRNLEKRKGKLDSYKQELKQGKALNSDQLIAVANYNEVAQQLDLAREMMKQFAQIQTETYRSLKKQHKKDQAERSVLEIKKYKEFLIIQSCLRQMAIPKVREHFQVGRGLAILLKDEDFAAIKELQQISTLELTHPYFSERLRLCAEQLLSLCEEKSSILTGQTTFQAAKKLLLQICNTGYFDYENWHASAEELSDDGNQISLPPSYIEILERMQESLFDTSLDSRSEEEPTPSDVSPQGEFHGDGENGDEQLQLPK